MPATLRRKKHASTQKKRKPRHRKTHAVKKKYSLKRGGQAKRKPQTMKHVKNSKNSSSSPSLNDCKILRQLERPNKYMTSKAKWIMISFVRSLYRRVSIEAEQLRKKRNRNSIGFTEMRTALRSVIPMKCKKCVENTRKSGGSRFTMAS